MPEDERVSISSEASTGSAWGRLRDWRVWLGIAITVLCLVIAMRGVPLGEVWEAVKRADLLVLLGLSLPCYVANVFVRALRWRHLTNPIASIDRAPLFRAAAIGFMVNNLVPLRVGEIVRTLTLARETGTSPAAILATVVLERILDTITVLLIGASTLAWLGASSSEAGLLAEGAKLLLLAAVAPVGGLVALRVTPEPTIAFAVWCCRPLPARAGNWLEHNLRSFAEGLGALSGGWHLFWLAFHSMTIWLVISTIPLLAGVLAFGLDLGTLPETVTICWLLLAAVGASVALPSAPGFFGPYQLAFKVVLVRFGVDPATALALGLLVWFVFWAALTLQGLIVVRLGHMPLAELTHDPSKDPATDRR